MLINESNLRKIIRDEIANLEKGKKLIVQDDEIEEHGGYDIDRPAIPGQTTRASDDPPAIEYEGKDSFQQVRLARMKAAGVSDRDAQRMSRSKLKHRGKHPGHG